MSTQQKMEYKPLGWFKLYDNNPRKNDHVVAQMADMISRFGFRIPVLARGNGEIVDGHLRYKAAKQLGLDEVPYINCDDMSASEIRAFRIAVNKAAELADWDIDLLSVEFEALKSDGFTVEFAGFDVGEVETLFAEAGTPFMNTPPPLGAEQEVKPPTDAEPPEEFESFDEDINVDYCCPKCGWEWSGKPK